LYRYIGSKSQLLQDLAVSLADIWVERLEDAEQTPGNAEDKLRAYLQAALSVVATHQSEMALTLHENRSQNAEAKALLKIRHDRIKAVVRRILQAGRDEGLWRDVPLSSVYVMLFGMVNWTVNWYRPDGASSAEQIANDFADILLGGLRGASRVDGRTEEPRRTPRTRSKVLVR
jgi:AcrR family transcriptional regulator